MLKRYLILIILILIRNPETRAKFCKKIRLFYEQGEKCSFTSFNFGVEPHLIKIGQNVRLAAGVRFLNHDTIGTLIKNKNKLPYKIRRVGTIIIGDNVFIGADSKILYDVKIGNNVIVAAGSIVTKDIPDDSVAAGIPAKVVGKFDEYEEKLLNTTKEYPWTGKKLSIYDKNLIKQQQEYFWDKKEI